MMEKDLAQFLVGVLNMFKNCTSMRGDVGEEVTFDQAHCIGLRGVAFVKQVKRKDTTELTNRVDYWATDKEKFQRVVRMEEEENIPFA